MASRAIRGPISLRLPLPLATKLEAHLFPGDGCEHGAVIGAAILQTERGSRLLGRRLFLATDEEDYIPGLSGHRMLTADFVRRCALACADEGLAYLAAHNHPGADHVAFSSIDMASHRRGYPALVDILDGPPEKVVFARRAVAGDIWISAIIRWNSITLSLLAVRSSCGTRRRDGLAPPGRSTIAKCAYLETGAKTFSRPRRSPSLEPEAQAHSLMSTWPDLESEISSWSTMTAAIPNNPRVVGARPRDLESWPHSFGLARLLRWKPSYKVIPNALHVKPTPGYE